MALIGVCLVASILIGFVLLVAFPKEMPVYKLTTAEERAMEIGDVITPDNCVAIVNFTIEEGYDHPALAARKSSSHL
jgi:hypothetical protein